MITDRIGLLDVLLPINHNHYNFGKTERLKYDNYNFGKTYVERLEFHRVYISHKENSLNRIGYLVTNNIFRKR